MKTALISQGWKEGHTIKPKGVQIMGILVWLDKKNISRSFTNPKRRPKPKTVKGNRIRRELQKKQQLA